MYLESTCQHLGISNSSHPSPPCETPHWGEPEHGDRPRPAIGAVTRAQTDSRVELFLCDLGGLQFPSGLYHLFHIFIFASDWYKEVDALPFRPSGPRRGATTLVYFRAVTIS